MKIYIYKEQAKEGDHGQDVWLEKKVKQELRIMEE